MTLDLHSLAGVLIPFAGTSLGAAGVLFLKRDLTLGLRRGLTGFAAGVMVAASIWSLLIPAIDRSASLGVWAFFPAAAGFWCGKMCIRDRREALTQADIDELYAILRKAEEGAK